MTPFALTSSDERNPKAPSYISVSSLQISSKMVESTYPILNRHSHKPLLIRIDNRTHILRPIADAVSTAVNPH